MAARVFLPGANDPAALDKAMRLSLASSLSYIHSAVGFRLGVSASDADAVINNIQTHRVRPGVFGRYYKLVFAIESGQFEEARSLLLELASLAAEEPAFSVMPFTDAALGPERKLYSELIDPNPGDAPWMVPPPDGAGGFGNLVPQALSLLDVIDKELAAELRGLVIEVVGASEYEGLNARSFGSVSSLMLWGLMVVNVKRHPAAAELLLGLVHEAAHMLLFAHSRDEPLVTNPIGELYDLPLRSDPRPMDGVYHATFVLSRVFYAMEKLRQATTKEFAPLPISLIEERLAFFRERYFGGLAVI